MTPDQMQAGIQRGLKLYTLIPDAVGEHPWFIQEGVVVWVSQHVLGASSIVPVPRYFNVSQTGNPRAYAKLKTWEANNWERTPEEAVAAALVKQETFVAAIKADVAKAEARATLLGRFLGVVQRGEAKLRKVPL